MLISRVVWMFLVGLSIILGTGAVVGQDFPNKPIRLTASAGGGSGDFAARVIAPRLTESLGRQVIVDNRGVSLVAIEAVAKAPPDGYTLLIENTSFWVGPLLRKLSYDPVKDFSPVTLMNRYPNILVIHPSMPIKSVKELIALAKARPGELNYASVSIGGSTHLAAELFKSMAGVKIAHVPYKGAVPGLTDLLGGQVQLMFAPTAAVTPHIKSGRLKALAVTSAEPSVLAPGLPSIAASGVPGYESVSIQGLFAPAHTPMPIINRLSQETVRILNRPEVKETFLNSGTDVVGTSPEQFAAAIVTDIARTEKLIKDAGLVTN